MARLELRAVKKRYGKVPAIHGIDLDIPSGEFCVFVGPSGCGKSTLLRMIAGLEDITAGEVAIDGEVVNAIPAAKRGLAMVFQSYALYPHMSVRSNLSFGLENVNMPRPEIDTRVNEAARMLQIEDYLDRRPGQLSGGQRQRVAIGRAVVREPRIFLFDEPLSNLDAELRVATRGEISTLHRKLGNTMVYVTHDQVEAMTMADKIAVLRAGLLEQFGAPLDLYNHPANSFVARFIGSPKMNFIGGTVADGERAGIRFVSEGAELALDRSRFAVAPGTTVELGIRPNHLRLSKDGDGMPVEAKSVEQLGGETFVYGTVPDGTDITVHMQGQVPVEPGEVIHVEIDPALAHLFDGETGRSLSERYETKRI
ncbi:MAG: sn-glycerol-3-phosphate ABC transporter ATP-binding protein UgpC [Rhizobiaceae bacterium]|nr:sn-glycerol-3-phosphate ABC transporter ATP-binding protein UgpC [Rhizobiaceae bacterium]